MKKLVFRVPVSGGEITQIPINTAYDELTSQIRWGYANAQDMFAPTQLGPKVLQSNRYLYSLDVDRLKRNAERLGIGHKEISD